MATINMKNTNQKNGETSKPEKFDRVVGITSAFLTAFFFNFLSCCARYVFTKNPEVPLSGPQLTFIRGFVQLIMIGVVMTFTKTFPFENPNDLLPLFLSGCIKATASIFCFTALKGVSVGTVCIIESTTPAVAFLFGFVFLKEKCSMLNGILGLLTFVGIVIVMVPNIIFPVKTNYIKGYTSSVERYLLGAASAFAGVLLRCTFKTVSRILMMKTMDYKLFVLYPSVAMLVLSPLTMLIQQDYLVTTELPLSSWLILIVIGISGFLGNLFSVIALKHEHVSIVAFVASTEILFAYCYDLWLAHEAPNPYSWIGIITVVLCSTLVMLNRIFDFENKIDCCKRNSKIHKDAKSVENT
eukprot:TCONS_00067854-protein